LIEGLSNSEIATARQTSVRTVANQVASILRKVGVRSRSEAVTALGRLQRS
jgi:DNA-binding NarL/FixJ family response regulator